MVKNMPARDIKRFQKMLGDIASGKKTGAFYVVETAEDKNKGGSSGDGVIYSNKLSKQNFVLSFLKGIQEEKGGIEVIEI